MRNGLVEMQSALLGLALVGVSLPAQTPPVEKRGRYWVQQFSGTIPAGGRVRVSSTGDITIRGAETREVRYQVVKKTRAKNEREARALFEDAVLTAARRGNVAVVTVTDPGCRRCGFRAEITLTVPRRTFETVLNTRGGRLEVVGVEGGVTADSAGGEISLDAIGGSVRAATAGGAIRLGSIGGVVRCETAGGSIEVLKTRGDAVLTTSGGRITAGEIGGDLRAETAGGGIKIGKVGGRVVAGTSGGGIEIGEAGGMVNAETAGGSIRVGTAPRGVRAETAAGDIRLADVAGEVYAASAVGDIRVYFIPGAVVRDSLLETTGGVIVVWLPKNLAVTIDAAVDFANNPDRIESDFPGLRIRRSGDGLGPSGVIAQGKINGGGALLRIRNTSGRIEIRERK